MKRKRHKTDEMELDPLLVDADGLQSDVQQVLRLAQAVTTNN
ncbi:hypothetical protein MNBD_PLANCTO03-616 [hydrothermal vent metagenome]|uniref:Uncharacterized protein n=1 Tax=hydrothermal vent metagenome TaxID=652676 RepID=A0A3B1DYU4_9ZZZZ